MEQLPPPPELPSDLPFSQMSTPQRSPRSPMMVAAPTYATPTIARMPIRAPPSELELKLQENAEQLVELREELDEAKEQKNEKKFKKLAVLHAATLAERRQLLREKKDKPWMFKNQEEQFRRVMGSRRAPLQRVNGIGDLSYKQFAQNYKSANPKETQQNIRVQWRKFKELNKLPKTLSSCARLPADLCDENPNCEYAIGMKKSFCRKSSNKASKKSRRRSRKKTSRRRKCSRGMRKGSKVCKRKPGPKRSRSPRRKSPVRRSRSPARRRRSPARKSRSPARRRRCARGVKKTPPRKGSCRRKPGRKSRARR